jgi:hypothetical protein
MLIWQILQYVYFHVNILYDSIHYMFHSPAQPINQLSIIIATESYILSSQ